MNSDRSFDLRRDVPASLVVFFVAVPLCLGIALASLPSEVFPDGVPLASGLIAGIIGGLVVGAISGSPLGVSGPAAGLAVIVYTAIEDLGSFEVFLVAGAGGERHGGAEDQGGCDQLHGCLPSRGATMLAVPLSARCSPSVPEAQRMEHHVGDPAPMGLPGGASWARPAGDSGASSGCGRRARG